MSTVGRALTSSTAFTRTLGLLPSTVIPALYPSPRSAALPESPFLFGTPLAAIFLSPPRSFACPSPNAELCVCVRVPGLLLGRRWSGCPRKRVGGILFTRCCCWCLDLPSRFSILAASVEFDVYAAVRVSWVCSYVEIRPLRGPCEKPRSPSVQR